MIGDSFNKKYAEELEKEFKQYSSNYSKQCAIICIEKQIELIKSIRYPFNKESETINYNWVDKFLRQRQELLMILKQNR